MVWAAALAACGEPVPVVQEGDPCQIFCDLVLSRCHAGNVVYPDQPSCAAACARFSTAGAADGTRGDTLQCRMFYASVARLQPRLFCRAAGPDGGALCAAPPPANTLGMAP